MTMDIDQKDLDRFWAKVQITDGCWLWCGSLYTNGYGRFWAYGRMRMVHRFSYEIRFGSIPDGMFICHACDHPPCVRPDHLFLGSHADNMADMRAKGRRRSGPSDGENNGNAKLNLEQVQRIREEYGSGVTKQYLAEKYGVTPTAISHIITRKTWKV